MVVLARSYGRDAKGEYRLMDLIVDGAGSVSICGYVSHVLYFYVVFVGLRGCMCCIGVCVLVHLRVGVVIAWTGGRNGGNAHRFLSVSFSFQSPPQNSAYANGPFHGGTSNPLQPPIASFDGFLSRVLVVSWS